MITLSAGVRRINAITGTAILNLASGEEGIIKTAADILKTNTSLLLEKVNSMNEELKAAKKELAELKKAEMNSAAGEIMDEAETINGIKLITKKFSGASIDDLRTISDDVKKDNKGVIMVFAAEADGKVTFIVSVTDDLLDKGYHAGNMIKQIAAAAGGGGGGKADMAQAGAKDPSKIDAAFEVAKTLIK